MSQFPKLREWACDPKVKQAEPEVLREIRKTVSDVSQILTQPSISPSAWPTASHSHTLAAILEREIENRAKLCATTLAAARYCSKMLETALTKDFFIEPPDTLSQKQLLTRVFANYILTPVHIFPHREAPIWLRNLSHHYDNFGNQSDEPNKKMYKLLAQRIYEYWPIVRTSFIEFRETMLLPPSKRV